MLLIIKSCLDTLEMLAQEKSSKSVVQGLVKAMVPPLSGVIKEVRYSQN